MIFINRTQQPPASLEIEKFKKSGSYGQDDVRELLENDFYGKCYICEITPIQDGGEIEHLIAHKGDIDKKFDWNNLFLSCGHCNSVKNNNKFNENILNCTNKDPFEHIEHILYENTVVINKIQDNIETTNTALLIEECFNGNTTFKRNIASSIRLDDLKKEMSIFYKIIYKYLKTNNCYYKKQIIAKLKNNTKFTAFKRDYIRKIGLNNLLNIN